MTQIGGEGTVGKSVGGNTDWWLCVCLQNMQGLGLTDWDG